MPERSLVAAVLERAFRDAMGDLMPITDGTNSVGDARGWFSSRSVEPYSFLWCCYMLELDPDRVLEQLKALSCWYPKRLNLC